MQKIKVSTSSEYEILIEKGIRLKLREILPKREDCKYIVLTDENVDRLYGRELFESLSEYNLIKYVLKPGENSSHLKNCRSF